jgi:hypothetical protein
MLTGLMCASPGSQSLFNSVRQLVSAQSWPLLPGALLWGGGGSDSVFLDKYLQNGCFHQLLAELSFTSWLLPADLSCND